LQPGGHRFDPGQLHQKTTSQSLVVNCQRVFLTVENWQLIVAFHLVWDAVRREIFDN
jgi:hypothetical protein